MPILLNPFVFYLRFKLFDEKKWKNIRILEYKINGMDIDTEFKPTIGDIYDYYNLGGEFGKGSANGMWWWPVTGMSVLIINIICTFIILPVGVLSGWIGKFCKWVYSKIKDLHV